MTTLVLGHLVLDEIHPYEGSVIESLGGIFFPVSAFAALARESDRVIPCFPLGADAHEAVMGACRDFERVSLQLVHGTLDASTRVRLFHDAMAQYNTQLVHSMAPIEFKAFEAVARSCDLVYINFMTGEDLTLDAAERLRDAVTGLIYLDLHMIAYRVGTGGHRTVHPVQDWKRWARIPHVLQCNERELGVFVPSLATERDKVDAILDAGGVQHIVLTRGEGGASIFSHDDRIDVPAFPLARIVDSTGCGDVFGSTLAYYLAKGMRVSDAALRAARAGAFVAGIPGSIGMHALRNAVEDGAS